MRITFKLVGVLYKADLTSFENLIFLLENRLFVSMIKE